MLTIALMLVCLRALHCVSLLSFQFSYLRISSPRRALFFGLLDPKDEGIINCETQEQFTQQHSVNLKDCIISNITVRT